MNSTIKKLLDLANTSLSKIDEPPYKIWMNETTIKAIKESCASDTGGYVLDISNNLFGIPVFKDNDIPDFEYETNIQRNDRLKVI